MGKKGSSNPADAFRKQQKARELKKNKVERKKKREDRTAKQDTRELEAEIAHLKSRDKLSDEGKERLAKLETELSYVKKLKEKYVAAHPEAKDRILGGERRGRRDHDDGEEGGPKPDPMAHLYNPDGTLRDPKRSAYYDPIYNPFGVPPPGMPYRERSPVPGEESESSDDSEEDDSDDDIVMPEGPPPGADSDSDSDDSLDIPLPEGPPPPRPPPALPGRGGFGHPHGPRHHGHHGHPGPSHRGHPGRPPMPFQPRIDPSNPGGWGHLLPSGPAGPSGPRPPVQQPGSLPPRPATLPPPPSSLPAKPGSTPAVVSSAPVSKPAASAAPAAPVVISAEPQLRDLRKEATIFVPRGVAKKKAPGGLAPVNAAPQAGPVDADGDSVRVRAPAQPGLMGKLSNVLGPAKPAPAADDEAEDEYARFLEGLEKS